MEVTGALEEEALRARLAAAAAGGGASGFTGEERIQMEAGSLGYTRLSASTHDSELRVAIWSAQSRDSECSERGVASCEL